MIHKMDLRIYYKDTDAGGIVYHSNYLEYAERARTEFLHDIGLSNKALIERDIAFIIKRAEIDYKSPARLEDVITVHTRIGGIKNASMIMLQTVKRAEQELVDLKIMVVFVNPHTLKPVRIPEDLKEKFACYLPEGEN